MNSGTQQTAAPLRGGQATAGVDETRIAQFLYREARLQDEHRYDEWETLWTDDALYWVPAGGDDTDPERQVSFIYDNRARLASRIRQLKTGWRIAQEPASRMRRLISNIEIESAGADGVRVGSNFLLAEHRRGHTHLWAGRAIHLLRDAGGDYRLAMKKVLLVDNAAPIPTLAFLI